jgi:phosphatidylglycerol:prolipoprotein diacylglycerol transferase
MLPYVHVPDLRLGPLTLHPFGILVAMGVIVGSWLTTRRARQRDFDVDQLYSFVICTIVAGFLGSHVFDLIFYRPTELVERPWSILMVWEGLSSFGGFIGGLIGAILWKYVRAELVVGPVLFRISKIERRPAPVPLLPLCDLVVSVFPLAWVLARSGCAIAHDHLGRAAPAGALLAVAFPESSPMAPPANGPFALISGAYPRYDLGLLEMLFCVGLSVSFVLTWRRDLPTGSYVAAFAIAYAPMRFALEGLRSPHDTIRYGLLTPTQWACVALFMVGLFVIGRLIQRRGSIDS